MPESFYYPEQIHLEHTFENGQCFRWRKIDDEHYMGVVYDRVLEIKHVDAGTLFTPMDEEAFESIYKKYFGFGENLPERQRKLSKKDEYLKTAFNYCRGLSLLRQDPWEILITFILSQNNHIPRIRSLVEKLATLRGQKISYRGDLPSLQGEVFYTFPTPYDLSDVQEETLRELGFGYRAKYVVDATACVMDGVVDLQLIPSLSLHEAREELKKIKGVGNKVADCVLLFAYGFSEAFPVDVWVERALNSFYHDQMKRYSNREEFIQEYFGGDGGLAQQMLFHTLRNGRFTCLELS